MAETSMEEGLVEVRGHLVPCHICGRTFLPEPLKKHERVCEKNATRKRKVFNSQKQRVEGTELAVFHQKSYLKKNSGSSGGSDQQEVKPPPPPRKSKWKEKHLELVKIIREARGAAVPPSEMSPSDKRAAASTTVSSSNEKCPTCDRAFGPKAYDRHVEWCREHKSRVQKSSANVLVAKERLEARTKYRVPPLNKSKRQTVKEKYASKKESPHQSNLKSASLNNFDPSPRTKSKDERQNELNRKTTAGRNLTRGDSIKESKPVPQKKEPRKGSVEDLIKSSKSKPSTMRGSGKVNSISVNSDVLGMSVTQISADGGVAKSPGRLTTWVEEQRKRHTIETSPHCELKTKLHESEVTLHGVTTSTSNRLPVPMSLSNVCFSSMEEIDSPSPLSISCTTRDDSLGRHRGQEKASGRPSKFKVFGGSKYVEQVISEKKLLNKDHDYKHEDQLKIDVDNDRFHINTFRSNDSSCASGRKTAQSVKTVVDIGIIDAKNDHKKGSLVASADVAETGSVNSKESDDLSVVRSDYSLKKQTKGLKPFKSRNTTKIKLMKDDNIYSSLPKSVVEEIKDNQASTRSSKNYLKSKTKKKILCDNVDIKETSSEENKTLQIEYESTNTTDLIKIKLTGVNSEDSIVDIKTSSRLSSPIVTPKTFGNHDCLSIPTKNTSEGFVGLDNIGFPNYEDEPYPTSPKFEDTFKYTSLRSSDEILAFSKNLVELVENNCNQLPIPSSESHQLLTDSTDTIISQDTFETDSMSQNLVKAKDSFDSFDNNNLLKLHSGDSFQDSNIYIERKEENVLYELQVDRSENDENLETALEKAFLKKCKENSDSDNCQSSESLWKQPSNLMKIPRSFKEMENFFGDEEDSSCPNDVSKIICYFRKRMFGSQQSHWFEHRMVRGDVSKPSTKNKNLKQLKGRLKNSSRDLLHPRSSQSIILSVSSGVKLKEHNDLSPSFSTESEKEIKTIDYETQSLMSYNLSSHGNNKTERHGSSKLYASSDYHLSTEQGIIAGPVENVANERSSRNTAGQFTISSGDSTSSSFKKFSINNSYKSADSKELLNFDSSDPSIFDTKESINKTYNYDSGFGSVDEQSRRATTETYILKDYTKLQSVNVLRSGKPNVTQQFHCLISDGSQLKSDPEDSQNSLEETPLTEKSSDSSANVKPDDCIEENASSSRKIIKPRHKRKLESSGSSPPTKQTFDTKLVTFEKWQSLGSKRNATFSVTESEQKIKEASGLAKETTHKSYIQNQNNIEQESYTVENTNSQLLPSTIVNEIINIATGGEDLSKKNRIIKTEGNFSFKTTTDITEEIIEKFTRDDPNKDSSGLPHQIEDKNRVMVSTSKFVQRTLESTSSTTSSTTDVFKSSKVLHKSNQNIVSSTQEKSPKTSKIPVLERSTISRKIKKKNEKYFKAESHGNTHACGESILRSLSDSSLCEHRPLTIMRSSSESSLHAILGNELIDLINRKRELKTSHNLKMFVVENRPQIVEEVVIPQQTILYQERKYEKVVEKSTEENENRDVNVLEYFETIFSPNSEKKESKNDQKNYIISDSRQQSDPTTTSTNDIDTSTTSQLSFECLKFAPLPTTTSTDNNNIIEHFKKSNSKTKRSKHVNSLSKRQTSSNHETSPLNAFLESLSNPNLENASPAPSKHCSNQDVKNTESNGSIMTLTLSNASSWNSVNSTVCKNELNNKDADNESINTVKVFKEVETGFDDLESLDGDSSNVWVNALSSARLKKTVRKCCSDVCVLKTFNLYANKGLEGLNRKIKLIKNEDDRTEDDVEFPGTTVMSDSISVDEMCSLTHSQIIRIAADDFLSSCGPKKQISPASSQEVIPKKRRKINFKKGITNVAKKIVGCFCKKKNRTTKGKSQCSIRSQKRRKKKKKSKSIITIANLANDRTKADDTTADSSEFGLYVTETFADFQIPTQINTKFSNFKSAACERTHTGDKKITNAIEDGSNKVNQNCLLCFFNVTTGGDFCLHDELILSSPKQLDKNSKDPIDTNCKMESCLMTKADYESHNDDFCLPRINVKTARKSAVKPKETTTVSLPPIDSKNQNSKEKSGCNSSCAELGYDPFLSAKRQLEELLEGDDFTPSSPDTPLLNITNNRPHTTNSTTKTSLPNASPLTINKHYKSDEKLIKENGKRSSVIDPPFIFQDKLSQLNEEFDLIENFIKENFPENKEKQKIDSFFLHHQKNINDDKYIINNIISKCNFGDDFCNIDPKLINENDNLIIPSNLAFDSSPEGDPIFTFDDVRNRNNNTNTDYFSVQYDKKIESAVEPKLATRNTKTNMLPALEKPNVTNKVVKSSPSFRAEKNQPKTTRLPQKTVKQSISINSYATPPIVSVKKKNNPSSPYLKRSLSLLEPPIKSRSQKNKEQIHSKPDRKSPDRKSPGRQQIISNEVKRHEEEPFKVSTYKATAEDLFAVDDELYEEYKKYEEIYLKEKQQKIQQSSDVSDDLYSPGKEDIQLSQKNSGDSAYSSLNRKPSKIRARSTKLTPLDCQKLNTESTSSSGTDTSSTSPSHPHSVSTQLQQQKVPKFCHECGSKYPIDSAKFCVNCGVKRLLL